MSKAGPAFAAALLLLLLTPATGFAQEAGKMGISIGFPSSVGFIWHLSDKIAVRPDFAFVHSSTEGSSTETSSLGTTLGVSVLFYVKKWDSVAAYVAPGFAWSRTHGEFASTLFPGQNESTNHNYQYSGSLGAQGWIGQRFSVFGELGLQYTRNSFEPSDFDLPQRSRSIGLGSGVEWSCTSEGAGQPPRVTCNVRCATCRRADVRRAACGRATCRVRTCHVRTCGRAACGRAMCGRAMSEEWRRVSA